MSSYTEVPISSLSSKKMLQLNNSTIIPRMYLYIEKYQFDPVVNAVVYDIEVGVQRKETIFVHTVRRRYSALQQFDDQIRSLFRDSRFLMAFPPKKIFGNKSEEFLRERADQLQNYLTNLVKVAGVANTPAFMRCFDIDADMLTDV